MQNDNRTFSTMKTSMPLTFWGSFDNSSESGAWRHKLTSMKQRFAILLFAILSWLVMLPLIDGVFFGVSVPHVVVLVAIVFAIAATTGARNAVYPSIACALVCLTLAAQQSVYLREASIALDIGLIAICPIPEQYCYLMRVKTLVCPHCQTHVPDGANICTGCGAEVVRGATRRERSRIGLVFVGGAVLLLVIALRAWQVGTGSTRLPAPNSDAALFLVFGALALLVLAYITGKTAGRFVRRSQIRFFRTYRHQWTAR